MNEERRKILDDIRVKLRAEKERIECLHETEAEIFINMPEGIQESEAGQAIQQTAE